MRLIAASSVLLVFAGALEGMVSPIPTWPLWLKLMVSATTLLALISYLRGGLPRAHADVPVTIAMPVQPSTSLLGLADSAPTEGRAP
jgi:hypothetical protein